MGEGQPDPQLSLFQIVLMCQQKKKMQENSSKNY